MVGETETFTLGSEPAPPGVDADHLLTASGRLSAVGGEILCSHVDLLLQAGSRRLIVDLSAVTQIDPQSLACVKAAQRTVDGNAGSIAWIGAPPKFQWVLDSLTAAPAKTADDHGQLRPPRRMAPPR